MQTPNGLQGIYNRIDNQDIENKKCGISAEPTYNLMMEIIKKIFKIVTLTSMIFTIWVAITSIVGIAITGFYPGIIVLLLLTMIPITSRFCAKKIISKSDSFQINYYKTHTIINLLTILIGLWMTFVILLDRVFPVILK